MASGSTGRGSNSGSKAFDFASDDILCSYEDYGNQDGNNGTYSDPSVAANPSKEFHKSRMSARSSGFPTASFSPPEESPLNQDVISTVESTMKKYADNLMRFLEGISSRLSQLELYCYNLDKSIKEMRTDLAHDHGESESKLKSLEKHIQEVHRSVQVLRDKQELADTQKELAKLQLGQKDSSSAGNTQQKEEKASDTKQSENSSDAPGQQLALALPQQVAPPQPSLPARPMEHQQPPMAPSQSPLPPQNMGQVQAQSYYLPSQQMTNLAVPTQTQYVPAQSQQPQSQLNQTPQVQSLPPYPPQQQWAQQVQPPPPSQQQPVMQPQIRPSSQAVYPSYVSGQPNQPGMAPNSMPMQLYTSAPQPNSPAPEPMPPYGYTPSGARPTGYMMYEGDVPGRTTHHHPSQQVHFQQNQYPPGVALQQQSTQRMQLPNSGMSSSSMRSHPYNELIEKMVGMGYRGDHVVGVIQRLEESGQPIDFNAVLDRLNGAPQRGWSG